MNGGSRLMSSCQFALDGLLVHSRFGEIRWRGEGVSYLIDGGSQLATEDDIASGSWRFVRADVIPAERQGSGLQTVVEEIAAQPLNDLVLYRLRAYEKQPFAAKALSAQDMSFVDELRKDAFGDVLPIDACRAVTVKRLSRQVGFAFRSVIPRCVDGLYFDRNKFLQCSSRRDEGKYPVNEV